jgi:hypothetical protein
MEEELDAQDKEILKNNVRIVSTIGLENYTIDSAMFKVLTGEGIAVSV